MIKIGVSSCFMYPDPNRTCFAPKTLNYLENDMARFLSRKGILPILLPDLPWEELVQFLEEMDGFVFQGGVDVSPKSYGEEPIENGKWLGDFYRDQYELKILDYAFNHHKPILGICRGFQMINVYFKGTLYQDISHQTTSPLQHRDALLYDNVHHTIEFAAGGILEKIYDKYENPMVNSVHHQGIKNLGSGLISEAICPEDQLVEAFRYKNMSECFVLGVQWHPEFSHTLASKILDPNPLFNYFLGAIKAN